MANTDVRRMEQIVQCLDREHGISTISDLFIGSMFQHERENSRILFAPEISTS